MPSSVPSSVPSSGPSSAPASRSDLAAADFVRLTTFRRTGAPVDTPVWVVADGDDLLVTTMAGTGKVKRVRHTARVELTPCSRRGVVADDAVPTPATATIDPSPATRTRLDAALVAKYGWQARGFGLVQLVTRKRAQATCLRVRVD